MNAVEQMHLNSVQPIDIFQLIELAKIRTHVRSAPCLLGHELHVRHLQIRSDNLGCFSVSAAVKQGTNSI